LKEVSILPNDFGDIRRFFLNRGLVCDYFFYKSPGYCTRKIEK